MVKPSGKECSLKIWCDLFFFSALVYLRVFRAGLVLELWIVMVCEVKSKTIDHQCFVPLGFSGKTSRSRSDSGISRIAFRYRTAPIS